MSEYKKQLEQFRSDFSGEFEQFDAAWKSALTSKVALIDNIIGYISNQRGKGLRPLIAFLGARVYGAPNDSTIQSALVMELLHTATLIHDDVVDASDTRRGFASLRTVWGNKISVLFGDFLLARSLAASIEMRRFEALEVLSEIAKRMAKGQLQEAALGRDPESAETEYIDMISDKTAALISGAVRLGVLSTANGEVSMENWKEFGEKLGIAFQIRDDVLDYTGTGGILGKPVGGDLKDSKITMPLICAFHSAGQSAKRSVVSRIKSGLKRNDIKDITAFVKENNGIHAAQEIAVEYAESAIKILHGFPPSTSRDRLEQFVRFSIERDF